MQKRADIIVKNARILTMDPHAPRAEAIALGGCEILAVGTSAEVAAFAGPDSTIIDAKGGSVVPGFIESHMHLFVGGAELDHLQLAGVKGFDMLAKAVRDYAASRPDAAWLQAQGADYTILSDDERVTRHRLDRIIADRPFIMAASDHHTVWANTKALELGGILHGRELGPGNEIVMGEDGLATGELREGEAFAPLVELTGEGRVQLALATGGEPDPRPTEAERASDRAVMKRGLEWCARHGITSIQNMDGNLHQLEVLAELQDEGGLLCRVQVPFHYKNFMTTGELTRASAMAERFQDEWLSSGMVKVFMDGVLDSWTAVMVEPYADRPDWTGEALFTQAAFDALAIEADRRGLQIAVHAIGDGAVRSVLNGYEAAREANGQRDSRHRIEHIEVITKADIPRLAELGVIASLQPPHAPGGACFPLEPVLSRIGSTRRPLSYAWRTLKDTGAHVAFSSDWPVSPVDPIAGIQAAVVRRPWTDGDPDQSFTLMEALAAYTIEGAYAEFMEHRKGTLKTGYLADLVVLSGDFEAVEPAELHTITPVITICGGKITYRRSV